jgi:acyl-CoA hydrolase
MIPDMKSATPLPAKPVSASQIIMTEMVLPSDTNALGTIFGGKVVSLIDIAAAMAAGKHSRSIVVTASIDALHFISSVKLGEYVHIKASVNYAGRTSMEIGVRVDKENPLTGELAHTATAYLTFVALDENGKPKVVPPIAPSTEDEKRRFEAAKIRRAARVKLAEQLKAQENLP